MTNFVRRAARACGIVLSVCVIARGAAAAAQAPVVKPTEPPAPAAEKARPRVTREEMARAYLHFDSAFAGLSAAGELTPERRTEISRTFDEVTMLFFAAKLDEAIVRLNALTAKCLTKDPEVAARCAATLSQHVVPTPRVMVATAGEAPSRPIALAVTPIGAASALDAARVSVLVTGPSGETLAQPLGPTIRLAPAALATGRYTIALVVDGLTERFAMASVDVVGEAPEALAARWKETLAGFEAKSLGRERDRAAFASRIALLTSKPSVAKSAQFLTDQAALARDCALEAAAIERGESFWKGRKGDDWRTIRAVAIDTPCRVYVPETLPADAKPALVVALHGAGGDESMFMDGYGAGAIKRLAKERGFVVVAPLTTTIATTPVVLDAIIEEMQFAANIDPTRVYLIGHSLGAMATGRLSELRGDRLAGVAMLAGGSVPKDPSRQPPTVLAAGGLDPLFAIARVREQNAALAAALAKVSVPYTYLEYPNDGHTLMVTAALPDVIDWLLRQPPRQLPKPPQQAPHP